MLKFRELKDKVFIFSVIFLSVIMFIPLFHIITIVFINGSHIIFERGISFLISPLSNGGIGPAIVGTFLLAFFSSLLGIPAGMLAGLYAYEYPNSRIGKIVTTLLQILQEFPTILVGAFVMYVLVFPMGTYSLFAGALALSIIMIPYIAVYTYEAMRQIPHTYREASFSMGIDKITAIFRVMVPIAKRGITTGILIGIAKVSGETAPLLFTAGGLYESYPQSINGPVGSVSLLIYTLVQSPGAEEHMMAWGASLVLLVIFLTLFLPIRMSLKEVKL